ETGWHVGVGECGAVDAHWPEFAVKNINLAVMEIRRIKDALAASSAQGHTFVDGAVFRLEGGQSACPSHIRVPTDDLAGFGHQDEPRRPAASPRRNDETRGAVEDDARWRAIGDRYFELRLGQRLAVHVSGVNGGH